MRVMFAAELRRAQHPSLFATPSSFGLQVMMKRAGR
jgi:hypothetical protein